MSSLLTPTFASFALLLSLVLIPVPGLAADSSQAKPKPRPKIALVLSGGGARGMAHVGVLKVLEDLQVPVDMIIGTSAGSIIGGMYAAGLAPEEIHVSLQKLDWDDVLSDKPAREKLSFRRKQDDNPALFRIELGFREGRFIFPKGLIAGQKLGFYLRTTMLRSANTHDFDQLAIPFRAVATDIGTGEPVVLAHGDLAQATRASMAVPAIFTPVKINGQLLVDGSLSNNLPVDIARALGADIIIAVNISTPLASREDLDTLLGISNQSASFLTQKNTQAQLANLRTRDILITPNLNGIGSTDFPRVDEIIERGENAARLAVARLQTLSIPMHTYQQVLQQQRVPAVERLRLDYVSVQKPQRVSTQSIKRRLKTRGGEDLDLRTLQQDLTNVYDLGNFEQVDFNLVKSGSLQGIEFTTQEKSWGPDYVRFGLNLIDDFEGDGRFNLLVRYNRTWLNALGAEWRNEASIGKTRKFLTEFYQPLDYSGRFFVAPYVQYLRDVFPVYENDRRIAEYGVKNISTGVDLGLRINSLAEARFGIVREGIEAAPRIGSSSLPSFDIQQGAYTAGIYYDRLDNPSFPRNGTAASMRLFLARDTLGADTTYDKLTLDWKRARTFTTHTLIGGLQFGSGLGTNLPFYDNFTLGGFLQLSGYLTNQLNGQYLAFSRLIYYQQITRLPSALGGGVYLGGSLEAGNVWNQRDSMQLNDTLKSTSLFAGADTVLGPLYLAYGYAQGGKNAFYLALGRGF